jgi:hypothetical protein
VPSITRQGLSEKVIDARYDPIREIKTIRKCNMAFSEYDRYDGWVGFECMGQNPYLAHSPPLCLSENPKSVKWYNSRPYDSGTFLFTKDQSLPHMWDALERKCHALPRMRDGIDSESRAKIEEN